MKETRIELSKLRGHQWPQQGLPIYPSRRESLRSTRNGLSKLRFASHNNCFVTLVKSSFAAVIVYKFTRLGYLLQWIIIDSGWLKCLYRAIGRLRKEQPSKYKVVAREIQASDWPTVDPVSPPTSNHDVHLSEAYVDVTSSSVQWFFFFWCRQSSVLCIM